LKAKHNTIVKIETFDQAASFYCFKIQHCAIIISKELHCSI